MRFCSIILAKFRIFSKTRTKTALRSNKGLCMNSSKLLIVLIALVAILASFIYYLFTNSKPKEISFVDKNASQIEESVAPANVAVEVVAEANESVNLAPNADTAAPTPSAKPKREIPSQSATQGSLRAEFESFLARSKKDTSLSEPRYSVYLVDNARLNALQKATLSEIRAVLSRRGGYLHYSLFAENLGENLKITLFNEDLLDETRWNSRALALENLWFKFQKSDLWSVKNSFHINSLKRNIGSTRLRAVEFSGHTDEIGNESYNYMLGLKRAAAIASEFLRQSGKITLQSFGKDKPLVQGHRESERYQNRRVESGFE